MFVATSVPGEFGYLLSPQSPITSGCANNRFETWKSEHQLGQRESLHITTTTVSAGVCLLFVTTLLQLLKLQCLMLLCYIRKDINLPKWKNLMTQERTLSSGSFALWLAGVVRIIWWLTDKELDLLMCHKTIAINVPWNRVVDFSESLHLRRLELLFYTGQ